MKLNSRNQQRWSIKSKAGSLKKINTIDKPLQNRAGSSEEINKIDKPQANWGKQREDTNQ